MSKLKFKRVSPVLNIEVKSSKEQSLCVFIF
jgi:hypothetical protein